MAILSGVGLLTAGAAAYGAYQSYFSYQAYEEAHLGSLLKAKEDLRGYFTRNSGYLEMYQEAMDTFEGGEASKIKNLQLFVEAIGSNPELTGLFAGYFRAHDLYEKNLSAFIDKEILPGSTTLDKLNAVLSQAKIDGTPKSKARAEYFQLRLEKEYLELGDSTEEGAYAELLKARREFEVAALIGKAMPNAETARSLNEKQKVLERAEETHTGHVNAWKAAKPESTRILLVDLAEDFVSKGRKEVLEKSVSAFDKVIKVGFANLYHDFQGTVSAALAELRAKLVTVDPKLVGESRWKASIFSWIYYAVSNWLSSKKTAPLRHDYRLLLKEAEKSAPTHLERIKEILESNQELEKVLGADRKAELEEARSNYLAQAKQLVKKNESLEEIILGNDLNKKTQLEQLYTRLKSSHPVLKDKSGEKLEYIEESESLHVIGEGYEVWVGGAAKEKVSSDFQQVMGDPGHGELLFKSAIPTNIDGYVEWKDDADLEAFSMNGDETERLLSSNSEKGVGKREILYAAKQLGSISEVGDKGLQDITHSKFMSAEQIIYRSNGTAIEFEGEGIRLGLFLKDNVARVLSGVPKKAQSIASTGLNMFYQNGATATFTLLGVGKRISKSKGPKFFMNLAVNSDKARQIVLASGKAANGTLLGLIPTSGAPLSFSIQEFEATFNAGEGVKWSRI